MNEANYDHDRAMIQTVVNADNPEMTKDLLSTTNLTLTHHGDFVKKHVISAVMTKSLSLLKCILDKYPEFLQSEYQMTYKVGKPDSCSLLHHAAKAGSQEMVEFLVHAGLDIKQRTSEEERTVLGFAVSNAHLNVVDYLLNTNTVDDILSLGADPIVSAGVGGSVEIFNKLVNVGFDPMQRNKYGTTTLHIALMNDKEELAFYIMKQYTALIHMTDKNAWSALHYASQGGSVTLLIHLIDIGLDTRCVDKTGCPILHIACLGGHEDAVMYLTQHHNYLLNIKDNNGRTALHHASEGGNVDIFQHLVTAGLDVHERDNDMENMLHRACFRKNHELIKYLLHHYSDHMIQPESKYGWYPFHIAAASGDEDILRLFMKHCIDICKLTSDGESVLHISCSEANIDTARFILAQFPQLMPMKDNYGKTALEKAVEAGALDIVKLFRKKRKYQRETDLKQKIKTAIDSGNVEMTRHLFSV